MPPLFSVVIPTYNRASQLAQAVWSILAQSCTDFEVIVVDDGSTDNTCDVMKSIRDDRVHYIWQENQERSTARNNGIAHAQGEFVAFLDSDDVWFPNKLALQAQAFREHPSVGVVHGACVRIDNQNRCQYPQDFLECEGERIESNHDDLLIGNDVLMPTAAIRRSVLDRIGDFDATLPPAEDWDMWIRASAVCDFYNLGQVVAGYRIHPGNSTSDVRGALQGDLRILDKNIGPDAGTERTPLRWKADMMCYSRHGFNGLAQGLPESEGWIKHAQDCAFQTGDPDDIKNPALLLCRNAFYNASYSDESRERHAQVLGKAAEIARDRGSPVKPRDCLRNYWATSTHVAYKLGDTAAALQCMRRLISSSGLSGIDRGLFSIAVRSLFRKPIGSPEGRIIFPIERDLSNLNDSLLEAASQCTPIRE